jgi:hypothetical protein
MPRNRRGGASAPSRRGIGFVLQRRVGGPAFPEGLRFCLSIPPGFRFCKRWGFFGPTFHLPGPFATKIRKSRSNNLAVNENLGTGQAPGEPCATMTPRGGGARGPVILPVFKAGDPALRGSDGGFDSHTLPPSFVRYARLGESAHSKESLSRFGPAALPEKY